MTRPGLKTKSLVHKKISFLFERFKSMNKTAAIPRKLKVDNGIATILPEKLDFLNRYCQSIHPCPPAFEVTTAHHGNDTVYEGTLTIF